MKDLSIMFPELNNVQLDLLNRRLEIERLKGKIEVVEPWDKAQRTRPKSKYIYTAELERLRQQLKEKEL